MKIKKSFGRKFATFLTVILTVSMLFLAAIYIGGTQFSSGGTAISIEKMPDSAVSVGGTFEENTAIYEKGLLPVSYAAINFSGRGGGAHGSEAAANALLDFAADPIHACLSGGASFKQITANEFLSATYGDYIYLDMVSALPYQMVYALTGEHTSVARSEEPLSMDRIIIFFPTSSTAKLFFSDGKCFYVSDSEYEIRYSEAAALAGDSRLSSFSINEYGVPTSAASLMLAPVSFKAESAFSEAEKNSIYSIFGYTYEGESVSNAAVAPHGTLRITPTRLVFGASQDGGISVSDFLQAAKNTLDISIYDILLGSVALCESLAEEVPSILSGADMYLKGFYRESDIYTVVLGAAVDSVEISGNAYPHFAKITVQNGRFRSIEIRFIQAEKNSFSSTLFPSAWQYAHASESADIRTLRLQYRAPLFPADDISAAWYFTGEKHAGGDGT